MDSTSEVCLCQYDIRNEEHLAVSKKFTICLNGGKEIILVMTTSTQSLAEQARDLVLHFLSQKPKKPLIVLIGPTASGKTDTSIQLARFLKDFGHVSEVINADSRQFYRFLDIGTAKISQEEMRGVPHHLLSVLDPTDECSIAWFQKEVQKVTEDLFRRGSIPLLVGGSMLYVSAIVDGLEPKRVDPDLRERLSKEYDLDEGRSLYARLTAVDPESTKVIPRENKVYVLRALEIYESTGIPKSKQLTHVTTDYDICILCLDPPKDMLDQRILLRTQQMFQRGWVEEVEMLLHRGYTEKDPAMMSHGYREILQHIREGTIDKSIPSLIEDIASKGRQYAKRHRTWWRDDPRVQWLR